MQYDTIGYEVGERTATITLGDPARPLELATLSPFGGTVGGTLELAGANGLGGKILVRNVDSPIGRVTADVDFAPLPSGDIGASSIAHVAGVGEGLATHAQGDQAAAVADHVPSVAGREVPRRGLGQRGEARTVEAAGHLGDRVVGRRRGGDEGQQVIGWVHDGAG